MYTRKFDQKINTKNNIIFNFQAAKDWKELKKNKQLKKIVINQKKHITAIKNKT